MCQILKLHSSVQTLSNYLNSENLTIKNIMDDKGGDKYSLFFYTNIDKQFYFIIYENNWYSMIKEFNNKINELQNECLIKNYNLNEISGFVVLFSRQIPEMEDDNHSGAPHFIKENGKIKSLAWMHGTISNDKELIEEKKLPSDKIKVDSEILLYLNDNEIDYDIKGMFTYLKLNLDDSGASVFYKNRIIDRGLGAFRYKIDYHGNPIDIQTTSNYYLYKNQWIPCTRIKYKYPRDNSSVENYYVLYSGGMDISLSAYHEIIQQAKFYAEFFKEEIPVFNINLVYFKYGSRAEEREMETLVKFMNLLYDDIVKVLGKGKVFINVLTPDISKIIQGFIDIYGYSKLTDDNAKGDIHEAESNDSYVPFRNTIFLETISTIMDKHDIKNAKILLGLNLTEGMTFGDNSVNWIEAVENVIKYGGKKYKDIEILAPFANKTKTNMIKLFRDEYSEDKLNQILKIAFSCYYPKNGEPCNECGSCILRNKAIQRSKE